MHLLKNGHMSDRNMCELYGVYNILSYISAHLLVLSSYFMVAVCDLHFYSETYQVKFQEEKPFIYDCTTYICPVRRHARPVSLKSRSVCLSYVQCTLAWKFSDMVAKIPVTL
jgi:hypothetical protein